MARTTIGQYPAKPELLGGLFLPAGENALECRRAPALSGPRGHGVLRTASLISPRELTFVFPSQQPLYRFPKLSAFQGLHKYTSPDSMVH